jgi:hypothetical protein
LLLAAASSCQRLSFLAPAAQEHVDVLRYEDEAEARDAHAPGRLSSTRSRYLVRRLADTPASPA